MIRIDPGPNTTLEVPYPAYLSLQQPLLSCNEAQTSNYRANCTDARVLSITEDWGAICLSVAQVEFRPDFRKQFSLAPRSRSLDSLERTKGAIVGKAKFILVDEKECWKPTWHSFLSIQRVHRRATLLRVLILARDIGTKIFGCGGLALNLQVRSDLSSLTLQQSPNGRVSRESLILSTRWVAASV